MTILPEILTVCLRKSSPDTEVVRARDSGRFQYSDVSCRRASSTQNGRAAFARKIDQGAPTTRYRCRSSAGDLAPLCGNQSPGCHPTGVRRPSGHNRSGSGRRPHGHRALETDRSRISTLVGSRRGASFRNGTKWHRTDIEFQLGFRLISRHCTPTVSTSRRKVENQKLPLASLPEEWKFSVPVLGRRRRGTILDHTVH